MKTLEKLHDQLEVLTDWNGNTMFRVKGLVLELISHLMDEHIVDGRISNRDARLNIATLQNIYVDVSALPVQHDNAVQTKFEILKRRISYCIVSAADYQFHPQYTAIAV